MSKRVRLVLTVGESDPSEAVRAFVDALTLNGMRDWVYSVEDVDSSEVVGYYNGFGTEVDLDEMVARQDAELAERDPEDIQLPPLPEFDVTLEVGSAPADAADDRELIELATDLNRK